MKARGYNVAELEINALSIYCCAVKNKVSLTGSLDTVYTHPRLPDARVVYAPRTYSEQKLKTIMTSVDAVKEALSSSGGHVDILICASRCSPAGKLVAEEYGCQMLCYDELLMSLPENCTVPVHTTLSDAEAKLFFSLKRIAPHQLPKILLDDPVCNYYGFKVGTLVKIQRTPHWAVYRIVSKE